MSRVTSWTVTCDVDKTTTGKMTSEKQLPSGWVEISGGIYGATSYNAGSINDVCPTCAAQLPAAFKALIPPQPT